MEQSLTFGGYNEKTIYFIFNFVLFSCSKNLTNHWWNWWWGRSWVICDIQIVYGQSGTGGDMKTMIK